MEGGMIRSQGAGVRGIRGNANGGAHMRGATSCGRRSFARGPAVGGEAVASLGTEGRKGERWEVEG